MADRGSFVQVFTPVRFVAQCWLFAIFRPGCRKGACMYDHRERLELLRASVHDDTPDGYEIFYCPVRHTTCHRRPADHIYQLAR